MIFQWIYRLWSYPWSGFTNRRRRRLLDNHDDSASTTCLPIDQDNDYCCQKPSLPSSCGRTADQDDDDKHCPAPSFEKEESHISHQRSRHQQQDKSPFQNTRHHQPIHNERRRVQPKVGFTKRPTPTTQHTLYSRQQQHKHASVMLRRRPRASLSIKHPPAQEEKTNNKNTTYHDYNDDNDPHAIIRRFVPPHARMFATALAEIQQERQKRGHWSWYFMPTPPHMVDGREVGSDMNRRYALRSLEEGAEYLLLPTTAQGVNLRDNYIALMTAIRQVLADGDHPRLTVTQLIGSDDVPKLFSSLAFFEHVGTCIDDDAIVSVCQQTARQCHQQSFSNDPSWELARPATCFRDTTKPTHDVDSSQDEQKQEEQRFDHHEEEFLMDYSDMSEDDMDEKELCPIVSAYDATTNHTLHYSSKRRKME